MGSNAKTTAFLKECMADSLIKLIPQKPFEKITVDDITKGAGVHRTTWFRNFSSKNDAITFKLIQLWNRWADEHMMQERHRFVLDNAKDFFNLIQKYATCFKQSMMPNCSSPFMRLSIKS